jgi:hypothetical protein
MVELLAPAVPSTVADPACVQPLTGDWIVVIVNVELASTVKGVADGVTPELVVGWPPFLRYVIWYVPPNAPAGLAVTLTIAGAASVNVAVAVPEVAPVAVAE